MSTDTGYAVLREVLMKHQPNGWAIEFGVYKGQSLRLIADFMPVIGLDSFHGLPEDWRPGFEKGKFHAGGKPLPLSKNAIIIPGLFSDTLPVLVERGLPHLGLVHIDCDLYSSTVEALEAVRPFIGVGTYIVFDEFHGYPGYEEHEMKAWHEFVQRYDVDPTEVASGEQEKAFVIRHIGGAL